MEQLGKGEYQGAVRSSMAAGGILIGLTEYVHDDVPSKMHCHENPHLSFVLKGLMAVTRKKHSGTNSQIEGFSYIRSGEQHQNFLVSSSGKNINLELEPRFLKSYGLNENHLDVLLENPGTSLMMVRLFREIQYGGNGLQDHLHMLMLSMLGDAKAGSATPDWVRIVRDLLNDNWDSTVSLHDISIAAGVHPVTVSKNFSRYFGTNLGEYRRRLKLERALELMRNSDTPLTELAHWSGFFDQSHFIRTFKEATGFLPRQYQLL